MLYNFSSTCLFQHLAERNNPRDYWVGHTRLPTFSNHVCLSFSLVSLSILLSWKQNVSPPSRLLQYFSFCTTLCVSLSLGFVVKSTVEDIKSHHWDHEKGSVPPPPPSRYFFIFPPHFLLLRWWYRTSVSWWRTSSRRGAYPFLSLWDAVDKTPPLPPPPPHTT